MAHLWPEETKFTRLVLDVEDRTCRRCGRGMHICDHRRHPIYTLEGPCEVVCRLVKCPDRECPGFHSTVSPEREVAICLPRLILGWDVFCWIGHRRFSRHWSVPQIRGELEDRYGIAVSADAIEDALGRYQAIVAAREQDWERLAAVYSEVDEIVLSIDGLQPEKGHETLYVVRELTQKRIWFGKALVSSSAAEVRRLLAQARTWAERLGKKVRLWMSDKQDALVSGIAAEFPGVPHRYCQNHFLRDVAKPVLEEDSHAKVRLRSKVRGLRAIERQVLQEQRAAVAAPEPQEGSSAAPEPQEGSSAAPEPQEGSSAASAAPAPPASAAAIVLDYCTVVKGLLNDDQGGPLRPPGLRMAEALGEVRQSLQRNLDVKKGGARSRP